MGGKASYARAVRILHRIAIKNKEIKKYLKSAKWRYRLHKKDMRAVNFDELIKKYAPGSAPYLDGYKIKYSNSDLPYIVIADPSGYARVLDTRTHTYVEPFTGKTLNKGDPGYETITHVRILRRDEL